MGMEILILSQLITGKSITGLYLHYKACRSYTTNVAEVYTSMLHQVQKYFIQQSNDPNRSSSRPQKKQKTISIKSLDLKKKLKIYKMF